jgi:hypothetical protein
MSTTVSEPENQAPPHEVAADDVERCRRCGETVGDITRHGLSCRKDIAEMPEGGLPDVPLAERGFGI